MDKRDYQTWDNVQMYSKYQNSRRRKHFRHCNKKEMKRVRFISQSPSVHLPFLCVLLGAYLDGQI
jgi:hypothetical protein